MATCQEVYNFLTSVANRNVTTSLSPADSAALQQLGLAQFLTAEQFAQLGKSVASAGPARQALEAEANSRVDLAAQVQRDNRTTHSIFFHLEGHDKQDASHQKEAQDRAALQAMDSDLTAREKQLDQLVSQRSLLDTMVPYGSGSVGLTGLGLIQSRDLGFRLYRVSDVPFATYWQQALQTQQQMDGLALGGQNYVASLTGPLKGVDRSYLWAIGIGLAQIEPDAAKGSPWFLDAYAGLGKISPNVENRLMSAEMLTTSRQPLDANLALLVELDRDVRKAGVPKESSLGVASILLLGRRADGTFATENLTNFLQLTKSYESAALLSILNRPYPEMSQKFTALRTMFGSWGFQPSEDVDLSSAYLTLSDLPLQGINTKLAILSKGMGTYLQYPLVASSILASIPVLEANETLNVLEHAYEVIGRRAMPMSQPELICLAVRMVHGVRNTLVGSLDTTATVAPAPGSYGYGYGFHPGFFFVPIIVAHGVYYSTFSGMGGAHPGHAHFGGGFQG
jgi:hypothetical protein